MNAFKAALLAMLVLALASGMFLSCDSDDGDDDDDDDDNDSSDDDDDDADQGWSVSSPDGRVTAVADRLNLTGLADYPDAENLYYRVLFNGAEILPWSPLGIVLEDGAFVSDLEFANESRRDINETYGMLAGKSSDRTYFANELTLRFARVDNAEFEVILRASNDGVAFRYTLPGSGTATALGELSGFRIPEFAVGWMQPHDLPTTSTPAHERHYEKVLAGQQSPDDGWSFPALFELRQGPVYVLLTEAGLDRAYCGTRLEGEPVERVYRVRYPSPGEGLGTGEVNPTADLPWTTPWRVMVIGDLKTVAESTLVDDLAAPRDPVFEDNTDWIRPGRAAWSWWSQNTGDEALQRQYVDSAAEFGWEYVLVDARWDNWPEVETAMPALADYAQSKGVGLLLWYNSGGNHNLMVTETPRNRMHESEVRRAEFAKLSDWGIKGVKVDFFHSDKQDRIGQYLDILADAADYRMLVNFHGCTIPRGWQRRYPNLMTMEAVRGAETYKPIFQYPPTALDHVRLVFTRNVVGSVDYTPVTFAAALDRKQVAYAHQLALSVVFESGLQHFADQADADPEQGYRKVFGDFPFVGGFMRDVPAAWDRTELVSGHPDSHAVLARKKGGDWWIGGISGLDADLDLVLPLSFLDAGTYDMTLIASGASPDSFALRTETVTLDDSLSITLNPRDGFVAHLAPDRL